MGSIKILIIRAPGAVVLGIYRAARSMVLGVYRAAWAVIIGTCRIIRAAGLGIYRVIRAIALGIYHAVRIIVLGIYRAVRAIIRVVYRIVKTAVLRIYGFAVKVRATIEYYLPGGRRSAVRLAARRTLSAAISRRRVVEFYYRGGYRTVEPFCLGLVVPGEATNESLLCYQTGGYAEMREIKGWKLYRLEDMEDIAIGNVEFNGARPGYDPDAIPIAEVYYCVQPLARVAGPAAKTLTELLRNVLPAEPECHTHNEVVHKFRIAHPVPIPALSGYLAWNPPLKTPPECIKPQFTGETAGKRPELLSV